MTEKEARGAIFIINNAYTHVMATHMSLATLELPPGGEVTLPPLATGLLSVANLIKNEFIPETEGEPGAVDPEVLDSLLGE